MTDEPGLPIPEIEPRPLGSEQYFALTPEKIELCRGYLIDPPDRLEGRPKLLAALLVNEGLTRVVRLASPERWQEVLQQVYGTANRKAARHRSGNQGSRREGQGREGEKG